MCHVTCECVMSHVNGSCHMCVNMSCHCIRSLILRMSHVKQDESCHIGLNHVTHEGVTSRRTHMGSHLILKLDAVSESCHIGIYMSHRNTSCHTRMSCFTHVNESCHVGIIYVTRMNESHRGHVTWDLHGQPSYSQALHIRMSHMTLG